MLNSFESYLSGYFNPLVWSICFIVKEAREHNEFGKRRGIVLFSKLKPQILSERLVNVEVIRSRVGC